MKICLDLGGGDGMTSRDASMLYHFMLAIAILIIILFLVFNTIPWIWNFQHSIICNNVPNWKCT